MMTSPFFYPFAAKAADVDWDGGEGPASWFDAENWRPDGIPGGDDTIFISEASGDGGVVYDFDPATDPEEPLWKLFITGDGDIVDNKLTLQSGTMLFSDYNNLPGKLIIGGGGTKTGRFIQDGGNLISLEIDLEIGGFQTSSGSGFYEYKSGMLALSADEGALGMGIRLGVGDSNSVGNGTFIVHNGGSGYIRTWNFEVGAKPGNGGGTVEFHVDANGTQPIQVLNHLRINDENHLVSGKRFAILNLKFDEAPARVEGVPINLGLFDVDFDNDGVGEITGVTDHLFYRNAWDGGHPYAEGDLISTVIGNTAYYWRLTYTGKINWSNANNSEISSILGPGNGNDVVLIGFLPGDYNANGVVDTGDYTVWRDHFGEMIALPNEGETTGQVTIEDYDYWKAHFGQSIGSGSADFGELSRAGASPSQALVPEPASTDLFGLGLLVLSSLRTRWLRCG